MLIVCNHSTIVSCSHSSLFSSWRQFGDVTQLVARAPRNELLDKAFAAAVATLQDDDRYSVKQVGLKDYNLSCHNTEPSLACAMRLQVRGLTERLSRMAQEHQGESMLVLFGILLLSAAAASFCAARSRKLAQVRLADKVKEHLEKHFHEEGTSGEAFPRGNSR